MKDLLTCEEAHRLFRYDAETGKLYLAVRGPKIAFDTEAGNPYHSQPQSRVINVHGKIYLSHRVIWLMHYGHWPEFELDYRDGNRLNTRVENLCPARDVPTHQEGRKMNSNNTSGIRGVHWNKAMTKWHAQVTDSSGKRKHLGYFSSIRDAERAVSDARTLNFLFD